MKKLTVLLAGAMLMIATMATSAMAIPTLRFIDAANSVTLDVADNSSLDANPIVGSVTYVGGVGSLWTLNVATGITKPFQGSAFTPYMDLNSVNSSSGAGTLEILFSDTGFMANPSVTGFTTNVGGTTQGTFEVKSFYDFVLFGTAGLLAELGPFGPGAFSGTETNSADLSDYQTYSLTIDAIINHSGRGTTSFDAELTPVPEPGTMMLLGIGLFGAAIYGKRRMNKDA